jgi:hypothetical protein
VTEREEGAVEVPSVPIAELRQRLAATQVERARLVAAVHGLDGVIACLRELIGEDHA